MSADHSTTHILQSLVVNLVITVAKGLAAFVSGSGAMLAETLHSFADCGNQLLLLIGVKRARKAPDEAHPFGYGRAVYFWSFIVALMLFLGGGVFSLYEGVHKLQHPERVEASIANYVVLGFALLLEGWATLGNVRELDKRRGQTAFLRYLRASKDSGLIVVFAENSAAVLGLVAALIAVGVSQVTNDARWDAAGTIVIGAVLTGVAVFLAVEIKSLLVGESADPELARIVRETIAEDERFTEVVDLVTMQQGPGEALVGLEVAMRPGIPFEEVVSAINEFEVRLRTKRPDAKWCYVEPDVVA